MVLNPHKCTESRSNTLAEDSNQNKCTESRSNTLTEDSKKKPKRIPRPTVGGVPRPRSLQTPIAVSTRER